MRVCVFLGPTLPVTEAAAALPAVYLPPVRQGDLHRAVLRYRPDVVGIVDGHFHQVPSVWHKEILWAMAKGVHVVGSASMGALRAAELHMFGMEGVGQIFEAYRDGVLEDDDEVAVIHGPAELDFVASSEAMVNMRRTFDAAACEGILAASTAAGLTAIAKARFYPKRRYRGVVKQAEADGLPKDQLDAFSTWLENGRIDAKRDDALAMLHSIRDRLAHHLPPKAVDYTFQHTSLWEAAITAPSYADHKRRHDSDQAIDNGLMDRLRLDDRYETLMRAGLLRLLAREEAERQGLTVDEEEHQQALAAFRLQRRLSKGNDLRAWLAARGLDRQDLDRLVRDGLLLDKVQDHLRTPILLQLALDELHLDDNDERLHERTRPKRESSDQENNLELTDAHRALTCYFQERCLAPPVDLDSYARRLGFVDGADFKRALLGDDRFRQISDEASLHDR